MPKYVFVTGGVLSGLGKGVTTASIAKLLQLAGASVTCVKIDPYLNVDAGTMNPIIHGEVFVTDDGGETDMDLGTYERFIDENLTRDHNITTGQVYLTVIRGEREGTYLGRCVQIIPNVTDEIKRRIRLVAERSGARLVIVECGGTVGDIESLPFLEAFRHIRMEEGPGNTLFVHVTLAPVLEPVGEQKTKPTQHSVQELRRIGIQPDLIIVRSKALLGKEAKAKISLFTSVDQQSVISNPDAPSVYAVPQMLEKEGILGAMAEKLRLPQLRLRWGNWGRVVQAFTNPRELVRIAMVGKYVTLHDSYVSVNHALSHAGAEQGVGVKVTWVDAEEFERRPAALRVLDEYHGVLIPGGFGTRGAEGKIAAANYAREKNIPYLGLCFGFQLAVVAFARHVCGLGGANSTELDPHTRHPVIDLLPEQRTVKEVGATMRLGGHDIEISADSLAASIYGKRTIRERHRHRFELNQKYLPEFERHGLRFTAFSDGRRRAEILELRGQVFYFATQYHPEFVSRPGRPEPAYHAFVKASLERMLRVLA
jgi:CTP synthase